MFKEQLTKQNQIGTFVKTPHPHIIEVLALSDLDFIILDAEHAPFDRGSLDLTIMAARLSGLPTLVRIQDAQPSTILNALDCGASGVQVPHVCNAEQAKSIAKSAQYGEGGRGYAGSSRAAQYATKPMKNHLADSLINTTVVAQIEDPEGVVNVESIAAVDGIDALFIGQVDLAVAYGAESVNDDIVYQASVTIINAAKKEGKPVGIFVADASAIPKWRKLGVTFFGLASEHKMIIDGFKNQRKLAID
ncbi:aldolase/citrate lyase family protein [Vibrio sp. SS-MA-C1-2]|uniref:HpcH/HpaI aldolase family protein n=1 Tax=Vibrio sp. SS-MA-C1-2 TaxID=2908646 RepID=UPI001F432DAE|nr:aldolase/citrate lyase family protein [Vibrio sp. SS-MA-C1-2]UJF17922.1 aldolase/citrate lyase family protein [Vibrio sp. SS-MA-C1-2]